MWRLAFALSLFPALAASAPAQPGGEPLDAELQRARSEQAAAEAQAAKLEQAAAGARSEAERLRAEEDAAAQAVDAAEARITTADVQLRLASAYVAAHRRQLVQEQRPVSSLLAGLAEMARRPPLLVLADRGSVDDLVRVRVLLDSTLPAIRARTRRLSAELAQGQQLEQGVAAARAELVRSQNDLTGKRNQFAALEQKAVKRSLVAGGQALSAGDVAIAAGESIERLRGEQSGNASARSIAQQLAGDEESPARPTAPEGPQLRPPFAYVLPAAAPVTEGLGSVNESGVRSRGLALATARGAAVAAPADGTVRYSGPFRDYDGVVIIDHGRGWLTLIVNVASPLHPGDRVRLGDNIGRALGPIEVELSQNGRRISPALIAGSSATLSKAMKGG